LKQIEKSHHPNTRTPLSIISSKDMRIVDAQLFGKRGGGKL
jgi:hypothetical protein